MSDTYSLWCLLQDGDAPFSVTISSALFISDLKEEIHNKVPSGSFFTGTGNITLKKIEVYLNEETEATVKARQYLPTPDDLSNNEMDHCIKAISDVWPESPRPHHLHVFVCKPRGIDPMISPQTKKWFKAALALRWAVWQTDLEKKLLKVDKCEDLKYLPPTEVRNLQLKSLGCATETILVREEYDLILKELAKDQPKSGGFVVTGQPGIGKYFILFDRNGVEVHDDDSTEWSSGFDEKVWAISDSNEQNLRPCDSFQWSSQEGEAFIVQATSQVKDRWHRWSMQCGARPFIMECFTEKEARALCTILHTHGIISSPDENCFLTNFKKWGPSARTCIRLALGSLSEAQLQETATGVAKKFARDPNAILISMEVPSQDESHVLFTVIPNIDRSVFTLMVTTPYLCDIVKEEIVKHDAAHRAWFYQQASDLPQFQGTLGCLFKKYFFAWINSKHANPIQCTPKSPKRSVANIILRPLGHERVSVFSRDSEFGTAKDKELPFGWLPASGNFPTFDAIICTNEHIITIQVTMSSKHTMSPNGFKRLNENLSPGFGSARTWHHIFLTDCKESATSLRRQDHKVAADQAVLIHSAVLDISKLNLSSEGFRGNQDGSVAMDNSEWNEEEGQVQMVIG